ncbi:MAG: hypothetical protein Q8O14_12895 [bacterium]|nr:hypothetical protein [bacterium]
MAKQNWDVKAFVAGQVALGRETLGGARKRLGRVDVQLQQAFLQLGQDAQLQAEMATVMGRMQALKESVEQVAERLDALAPKETLAAQEAQV